MTTSLREREYFSCSVYQELRAPDLVGHAQLPYNPPDLVPIVFRLYKVVKTVDSAGHYDLGRDDTLLELAMINDVGLSRLQLSSPDSRSELKQRLTHTLSTRLHVPEGQHQAILDQIFQQVDEDSIRPLQPLIVEVRNELLQFRPPLYLNTLFEMLESVRDTVMLEFIAGYAYLMLLQSPPSSRPLDLTDTFLQMLYPPPAQVDVDTITLILYEVHMIDSDANTEWLSFITDYVPVLLQSLPPTPPPVGLDDDDDFIQILHDLLEVDTEWFDNITDTLESELDSVEDAEWLSDCLETLEPHSLEAKKQETCPICMDDFEEQEDAAPIARLRPCLHVYHKHCILGWLHRKPLCPLCRCPLHQQRKRKLEEIVSSSTPVGPSSSIPRLS